jgi:acetylornithine deacetylase
MPETLDLLDRLVAFPTISRDPNLELILFVRDFLADHGAQSTLYMDATGRKANLFATIGPAGGAGIMLSGHTDVVPVEGQAWTNDPFRLVAKGDLVYGRGTADMKGFLASALRAAALASTRKLSAPLHLAFSYDEEIGCVGVRSMIDALADSPIRPRLAIVGEPTSMRIGLGHKGKVALRATCCGREGHSALAPHGLNAIHLASDFIGRLRALQADLAERGARDASYDVPYSTLHVGKISGGVALNIVPNRCVVDFELRNIGADDPALILEQLFADAEMIAFDHRLRFPEAAVNIETVNAYPGLDTPAGAEAIPLMKSFTSEPALIKLAFGSEGGLFHEHLGISAIVCGPGSIEQGHKPDEFISRDQLARCDAMMERVVEYLAG